MVLRTVEEIESDRVPPVYAPPLKFIDTEDSSRPALVLDLQGVLMYTFHPEHEDPPDLNTTEHKQITDGYLMHLVRKDAEEFLLLACRFANVYIWSCAKRCNVSKRVDKCFPNAVNWLSGIIGQELCDVADFKFRSGRPVFFKNLYNFWRWFPRYNEGTTLLIDDSQYKCRVNRPGTFIIVPKNRKENWMKECLGEWLWKWLHVVDRLQFAASWDEPPEDDNDRFVQAQFKTGGVTMAYLCWQKHVLRIG